MGGMGTALLYHDTTTYVDRNPSTLHERDIDAIHVRRNRTRHAISEHESKLNNLEDGNIAATRSNIGESG